VPAKSTAQKKKYVTPKLEVLGDKKSPSPNDLAVALSCVGASEDDLVSFEANNDVFTVVVVYGTIYKTYILRRGQIEAERRRLESLQK